MREESLERLAADNPPEIFVVVQTSEFDAAGSDDVDSQRLFQSPDTMQQVYDYVRQLLQSPLARYLTQDLESKRGYRSGPEAVKALEDREAQEKIIKETRQKLEKLTEPIRNLESELSQLFTDLEKARWQVNLWNTKARKSKSKKDEKTLKGFRTKRDNAQNRYRNAQKRLDRLQTKTLPKALELQETISKAENTLEHLKQTQGVALSVTGIITVYFYDPTKGKGQKQTATKPKKTKTKKTDYKGKK